MFCFKVEDRGRFRALSVGGSMEAEILIGGETRKVRITRLSGHECPDCRGTGEYPPYEYGETCAVCFGAGMLDDMKVVEL